MDNGDSNIHWGWYLFLTLALMAMVAYVACEPTG